MPTWADTSDRTELDFANTDTANTELDFANTNRHC